MRPAYGVTTLVLLLSSACQPTAPATISEADKAAIRAGEDQWVKLTNAKDWAGATKAYWSADAAILPPNGAAVQGQDGITAWVAGYPPFTDFTLQEVSVDGRGDLAYVHGTYSLMVTPPGATAPVRDQGKHVTIWKKQSDGSWKAILGIFNSDIPLPAPAPAKP